MGSNCPIEQGVSIEIDGKTYVQGYVIPPSDNDKSKQALIYSKNKAIQKAKNLGFTDEEIKALCFINEETKKP